jgi:hypothetical protein
MNKALGLIAGVLMLGGVIVYAIYTPCHFDDPQITVGSMMMSGCPSR